MPPVIASALAAIVGFSVLATSTEAVAAPSTGTSIATSAVTSTTTLKGNVEPALPANVPSKVAVVAHGAPVAGEVAIIVRNGAAMPVGDVRVSATATRSDGGMAVRAKTSVLVPQTIGPGELAIARLAFHSADLPSDASFTFKLESDRAKSSRGALEVRDPVLSRPAEGPVPQSLAVTLVNPGRKAVKAPIRVMVMCFGAARNPVVVARTSLKARLAGGATMPATVSLRELCPSYLVGAYGV